MLFGKRARKKIRKILIVEDEPLVAFDNEHLLSDAGYEIVATVDSLEEAGRVIAARPLDLILTDVKLRGEGSGLDVARLAAAHGMPVLFVTGAFPAEAAGLGIGCLVKPYDDASLLAALAACERRLSGVKIRKLPKGLSLFEPAS